MATLAPQGKQQYLTSTGAPLAGGLVYTYAAGTSTPLATYSDQAGTVPNANPVVLDSRGEATIFWGAGPYKVTVHDASDVQVWTQDDMYPPASSAELTATAASLTAADSTLTTRLNGGVGTTVAAALVTATGSTSARSLAARFADTVNVLDFGADPTGVADSTSAIQAAVNAGRNVYFPAGVYGLTADIAVPSGAHLIGVRGNASGQHTWLRQDSADYHLSVVGSSGAYNQYTEISGFTFTGASGLGIRTAYTEGLQVHDCNFSGTVYGLYMSTNANEEDVKPHIFRNTFGSISNTAIWTGDTRFADGWVADNTFMDCASYAMRIGYLDGGFIVRNAVFSDLASGTENNGFLIHKPVWARIEANQFFQVNGTGLLVTSPRWTHIEKNVAVWTGQSNRKEAFKIYSYTATAANDVWIKDNVAREVYGPGFTISFSVASSDIDVIGNHVTTAGYTSTSLVNDGFTLNGITRLRLHDNSVEGASLTRYWATFQSITGGDIIGNTHQSCVNDGPYLNSGNTGLWFKDGSLSTANATRAIGYHEAVVTSDATSGAVNLTLPSASITGAGKRITVVKVDSSGNAVGLAGTGGQTINGSASYSLTVQWRRVVVLSDGSNWIIESSN